MPRSPTPTKISKPKVVAEAKIRITKTTKIIRTTRTTRIKIILLMSNYLKLKSRRQS